MTYIVRVVTKFKDKSKYAKYYEFKNLRQANEFINNNYGLLRINEYSYEIKVYRCEELKNKSQ